MTFTLDSAVPTHWVTTCAGWRQSVSSVFESFVTDGHSEFFSADDRRLVSPPHHERLTVAEMSDRGALLEHLRRHSEGEMTYVETSEGLAASGVEKWVADTTATTLTYCDRAGAVLLVEEV
jgi:uncharacterized protein YbcV (DUF1398 family)